MKVWIFFLIGLFPTLLLVLFPDFSLVPFLSAEVFLADLLVVLLSNFGLLKIPVLLILVWWTGPLEIFDTAELVLILNPLDDFTTFWGFDMVVLGCLKEVAFGLETTFAFCLLFEVDLLFFLLPFLF